MTDRAATPPVLAQEADMTTDGWLRADEAASRLGVKPATLYAYVSRGQLRRRTGSDGRRSEYHPGDVADLAVRGRRARPIRPSDIVVPTAITRIGHDGPSYRGMPAVHLAGREPFEVVASRLWGASEPPDRREPQRPVTADVRWPVPVEALDVARAATAHLPAGTPPADLLLPAVAALRNADPLRGDLRRPVVVALAAQLLSVLAAVVAPPSSGATIADRLTAAIAGPQANSDGSAAALVDAALVLLADHELAASTMAVRVAASARCDPYAAAIAGIAVVSGRRHGAASRPLERAMASIADGTDPAAALQDEVRGDAVPGFGHPLYPHGDPRAVRLIELLATSAVSHRTDPMLAIVELGRRRGLPPPSIDVALAGLTHAIGASPGAGELLFAIARIAGWLAHALEQYDEPQLLRPSAVYVGA